MESDPERIRRSAARGTPPAAGGDDADRAFDELLRRHAVLGSDGASSRGTRPDTGAARAGDAPPGRATGRPPTVRPQRPPTNGRPTADRPERPPADGRHASSRRERPPTDGHPAAGRSEQPPRSDRPTSDRPERPTANGHTGNRPERPPSNGPPTGDRPERPRKSSSGTGNPPPSGRGTGTGNIPGNGRPARSPGEPGARPPGDRRPTRPPPGMRPAPATSTDGTGTPEVDGRTAGTRPPRHATPDARTAARPPGARRPTSSAPAAATPRTRRPRSKPAAPSDTADPPPPAVPKTPPSHDGLGFNAGVLRAAVAILAALLVAVTGLAWTTKAWLNSSIPQVSALDWESPAIRNGPAQAGDENVIVLTTDFPTPGRPSDPRVGSVVVAHVPAGGEDVVVLSLPTDLEINRPPCQRWDPTTGYLDQTVPAEARTTLLSAFEVGGPRCITRVVQQVTGLAVTRAVALDRAGVATVAAAVGLDACPQDAPPATERARVERDHQLLAAALRDTLSFSTLLAPPTLLDLDAALPAAVLADGVGIDRLLGLAQALDTLDAPGVTFAAAPTAEAPNSRDHTVLRDGDASALFKALREDTPLPELDDPRVVAASGPSPADVTVDVLNASGRDGIAANVAQKLTGFGFVVGEVGNAEEAAEGTVITHSPDQAQAAELLASSMPSTTLNPEPSSTGVLEVVLGSGFDDVVQAPVAQLPAGLASAPSDCA